MRRWRPCVLQRSESAAFFGYGLRVRSPRRRRKMTPAHCVVFVVFIFGFFTSALGISPKLCSCTTSDSWTTPRVIVFSVADDRCEGLPTVLVFIFSHRWLSGPAAALFLLSRARGVVFAVDVT